MTCTIKIRERLSPCCHCNGHKLQRDVIIICHIILFPASICTSGSFEAKKCVTNPSDEEQKETVERPETPQPPRPSIVLDHQRLLVI